MLGFGKKKKQTFDDYDDEDYGSDLDDISFEEPKGKSGSSNTKAPLDKKEQKRLEQEEKKQKYLAEKEAKAKAKSKPSKSKSKSKDSAVVAKSRLKAEKSKANNHNSALDPDDDFDSDDFLNTPAKMKGYTNIDLFDDDDEIDEEQLMNSVASPDSPTPAKAEEDVFDVFKTFEDAEEKEEDDELDKLLASEEVPSEPQSFSSILQEETSTPVEEPYVAEQDTYEEPAEKEDFIFEEEEVPAEVAKPSNSVYEEVKFEDGIVDTTPAVLNNTNNYTPLAETLNNMKEEFNTQVDEETRFHLDYANNVIDRVFAGLDKLTGTPYYPHIVLESIFTDELIKIYKNDKYTLSKINEFTILTRTVPEFSNDVRISMLTKPHFDLGKNAYEIDQFKTIPLSPMEVKILNYSHRDLTLISKTRPVTFYMSPLGTPLNDIKIGVKWQ